MVAKGANGPPPEVDDDPAATLEAQWYDRGVDVNRLRFDGATAVARTIQQPITLAERMQTLPNLLEPGHEATTPQFRLGAILGEGGMGVVRLAEQLALGREVAVKSLHAHAEDEGDAPQLLREARVTGSLEHPNVVPIYALGRDADGRPLIVMKRIEGMSWQHILDGVDDETRKSEEYLREHITTLRQVCLAVQFAHSKGIIHRDLKPDNVMIGAFGEIYLVDWGIAVSSGPSPVAGLPRARDISTIEGTPAYLSPEMAAGDGGAIDERSDVYLLGGILHQIITGQLPHCGADIIAVLTHAFASKPATYADHVPKELVDICHRAMARFNDDRYQSAAEFAEALAEFIRHRSSILLSDEAGKRLSALETLAPTAAREDTQRAQELHTLFSECRFGFTQALKEWTGNEAARGGLQRALTLMVEYELSRGAANAAANLLHGMDEPPQELADRVAAAVEDKRRDTARLAKLEHDIDLTFGARRRRAATVFLGAVWLIGCVAAGVISRGGHFELTHLHFGLFNAGLCAVATAIAIAGRQQLLEAANLRLVKVVVTAFAGYAVLWPTLGWLGVPLERTTLVHALVGALIWSTAASQVDRNWAPMSIGQVATFVGAMLWPKYHFEILGLFGTAASFLTAIVRRAAR